jgi:hypothetical protein
MRRGAVQQDGLQRMFIKSSHESARGGVALAHQGGEVDAHVGQGDQAVVADHGGGGARQLLWCRRQGGDSKLAHVDVLGLEVLGLEVLGHAISSACGAS